MVKPLSFAFHLIGQHGLFSKRHTGLIISLINDNMPHDTFKIKLHLEHQPCTKTDMQVGYPLLTKQKRSKGNGYG